jgi:hypothetical protein
VTDFSSALSEAKRLVRVLAVTAVVTVKLNKHGEPSDWSAQLATEPLPDDRWTVAGYVSVTGLVRSAHEAFSDQVAR